MSDTTQSERNFFQFDPGQLGSDWAGAGQKIRPFGARVSNWGATDFGARNSEDYTKMSYAFKAKADFENPTVPSFIQDAESNKNPFVAGSSVKRTRDDEFTVMGLGSRRNIDAEAPKMDVSDTNLIRSGMVAGKNYPTEGWRSFGGKYDFSVAYQG